MKNSTVTDIHVHRETLVEESMKFLAEHDAVKAQQGDDYWETVNIDDMQFDINIFEWEFDGKPVVIATAHPVSWDAEGYGTADMSNFVRLLVRAYVVNVES